MTVVGACISRIALVLSGSAQIPVSLITCPRNLTLVFPNSHFCAFKVTPAACMHFNTASSQASCSALVLPNTRTSSIWQTTASRQVRMRDILFWKCSGALEMPNGSLLKQKRPNGVINVVSNREAGAR